MADSLADSPAHIAADLMQSNRRVSRSLGRKQGIRNNQMQDESSAGDNIRARSASQSVIPDSASRGQRNEPSVYQEQEQEHSEKDEAAVEQHNPEHNTDEHEVLDEVVTLQKGRDKIRDEYCLENCKSRCKCVSLSS